MDKPSKIEVYAACDLAKTDLKDRVFIRMLGDFRLIGDLTFGEAWQLRDDLRDALLEAKGMLKGMGLACGTRDANPPA